MWVELQRKQKTTGEDGKEVEINISFTYLFLGKVGREAPIWKNKQSETIEMAVKV